MPPLELGVRSPSIRRNPTARAMWMVRGPFRPLRGRATRADTIGGVSNAESEILAVFAEEELTPSRWSNAPGASYASHEHAHHKVLFCIAGSITFITADGRETLAPGDRLDLPAGTRHAAVVGPDGVTCVEAFRLP